MRKQSSYVIMLLVYLTSCERDQDEYMRTHSDALLQVSIHPAEIEADGVSQAQVQAILSPDADKKLVAFSTDHGGLDDSSQKASIEASFKGDTLSATVGLRSSLEVKEEVKVSASISGITKTATLRFIRAYPDSMQLESTVSAIKSGFGSEVPLQVFLIRRQGIPSLHQQVSFKAIQRSNAPLGEFRAIEATGSNDKGIVNGIYMLKDTTYTGPVRIIASTVTKAGVYNDTLIIHVLNKN